SHDEVCIEIMVEVDSKRQTRRDPKNKTLTHRMSWVKAGLYWIWSRRSEIAILAFILVAGFMPDAMAQEARVRGFFTKARDLLIWAGPAVTIGCLFWGGAHVVRERPAGKQWAGAAIFLALTILSGVLQDWWT